MVKPRSQNPVRKTETTRNGSNRGNLKPRIILHRRVEGPNRRCWDSLGISHRRKPLSYFDLGEEGRRGRYLSPAARVDLSSQSFNYEKKGKRGPLGDTQSGEQRQGFQPSDFPPCSTSPLPANATLWLGDTEPARATTPYHWAQPGRLRSGSKWKQARFKCILLIF